MIPFATALLAALALPQDPGQHGFEHLAPADRAVVERPAIFQRTPIDLPRAEAGAWDDFADVDGREALLARLDPKLLEAMAAAERAYIDARYPDVLTGLYTVLDGHADFPPALMLLGTAYFRLRRYEDCRVAFERFLAVSPADLWRTQGLGHAYYSLGSFEQARDHYERVLGAAPEGAGESPEALRGLALSHMRLGDAELALALLARVIELRPNHAEAHTFRARILYDEDRLEEALEAANRARELAPFEPQGWYFAMRILFDLDREEEALEAEGRWRTLDRVAQEVRALEMLLKFRPGDFQVILRLSELAAEVGDVATVRGRLAEMILARPAGVPEADVRIFVLDVLSRIGDAEGARVAAVALEETCPESYAAWKRLERYYAEQRDRVNQVRCGGRASLLNPGG